MDKHATADLLRCPKELKADREKKKMAKRDEHEEEGLRETEPRDLKDASETCCGSGEVVPWVEMLTVFCRALGFAFPPCSSHACIHAAHTPVLSSNFGRT